MKRILITGANSYIGTSFENYIKVNYPDDYVVDTVDMVDGSWREKDFSGYDSVFHVAGIAHSDGGKISAEKERLYYAVNTALTVETAKKVKADGVIHHSGDKAIHIPHFVFRSFFRSEPLSAVHTPKHSPLNNEVSL